MNLINQISKQTHETQNEYKFSFEVSIDKINPDLLKSLSLTKKELINILDIIYNYTDYLAAATTPTLFSHGERYSLNGVIIKEYVCLHEIDYIKIVNSYQLVEDNIVKLITKHRHTLDSETHNKQFKKLISKDLHKLLFKYKFINSEYINE